MYTFVTCYVLCIPEYMSDTLLFVSAFRCPDEFDMGASTEQYCLRWNDFQSNIAGAFSDLRDEEDFLDVTLVSDGRSLKAHKLVLSACSPLFRAMLRKNAHPEPMIFLHGVRYSDVAAILNFMYHGEVNVNQEDLQTFLAAAEELRIRGLSDRSSNTGEPAPVTGQASPSLPHKRKAPSPLADHSSSPKSSRRVEAAAATATPDGGDVSASRPKRSMVITPDMPPAEYYSESPNNDHPMHHQPYGEGSHYDSSPHASVNLYHSGRGSSASFSSRSMLKDSSNGLQGKQNSNALGMVSTSRTEHNN